MQHVFWSISINECLLFNSSSAPRRVRTAMHLVGCFFIIFRRNTRRRNMHRCERYVLSISFENERDRERWSTLEHWTHTQTHCRSGANIHCSSHRLDGVQFSCAHCTVAAFCVLLSTILDYSMILRSPIAVPSTEMHNAQFSRTHRNAHETESKSVTFIFNFIIRSTAIDTR